MEGFSEPGVMELMSWLHGSALRGVLAMIDVDADAVAQVFEGIAALDANADQLPSGVNRWSLVGMRVADLGKELQGLIQRAGLPVKPMAKAANAMAILEHTAPPEYRQAAVELALSHEHSSGGEGTTVELVLYSMAVTAWLAQIPGNPRALKLIRQELLDRIAQLEGPAVGIPRAERTSEVSDSEAFEFLDAVSGGPSVAELLSSDPADWNQAERQLIALVKQHMFESPVPTSTAPGQRPAAMARLNQIFNSFNALQVVADKTTATEPAADASTAERTRPAGRSTKRRPGGKKRKRR